WKIPTTDHESQLETDQYDTSDAIYTIAEDAKGNILGCSRLIPTIKPYLLAEKFSFLCSETLPSTCFTWEISRFAGESYESNDLPIEIFKRSLRYAWDNGAKSVVAVTTVEMERYFKWKEVPTRRMGIPVCKNRINLIALEFPNQNNNNVSVVVRGGLHVGSPGGERVKLNAG
ncbi:acyl-homoserine-lactone synthase, partial [Halomonas sp. BC04]|uniref:acyl-homoserine-lactone synthase n=1 Tax=Halomonas sp. BC04 TaxID=1403540 RepID=UPI0009DD62A9